MSATAPAKPQDTEGYQPPEPVPADAGVPLPLDSLAYRIKRRFLGPPLHSDEMEHQRLGKPTALAVFASDNLSSSAYATEEILHVLDARWSGSPPSRSSCPSRSRWWSCSGS